MKKLALILLAAILFGCGPPKYHDYRDYEYQQQEEPLKFSDDPILDGYYRSQYLEMLRRCGSGDDKCRK
jgi:hypothetical protein